MTWRRIRTTSASGWRLRKTEARFVCPATEDAPLADSSGAPASAGPRFLSCRDVRSQAANRVRAYSSRQIYLQECKRCIIRGRRGRRKSWHLTSGFPPRKEEVRPSGEGQPKAADPT